MAFTTDELRKGALLAVAKGMSFEQYAEYVSRIVTSANGMSKAQVVAHLVNEGVHLCFNCRQRTSVSK